VITLFAGKPKLIVDLFERLPVFYDMVSGSELREMAVMRVVSALILYFQQAHLHCPANRALIEAIRANIFLFVRKILGDQAPATAWFSRPVFASTFTSLVFEPPVRAMVLSELRRILIDNAVVAIAPELSAICTLSFSRLPDERYIPLLCDILANLNEFLTVESASVNLFAEVPRGVIRSLPVLERTAGCEQYLVASVQFFAVVSQTNPLDRSDFEVLEAAICRVSGSQPSLVLTHKFVQLLAGTPLSSMASDFVIVEPLALAPLVRIVLNSPQLPEILAFLRGLIDFTIQNCLIATHAGFDAVLVDLVNEHKGDDFFSEAVLEQIFEIVRRIGFVASSTVVVQKFIALLCPIEGQRVSPFELFFMKQMTKMLHSALIVPEAWLALPVRGQRPAVTVDDFDTQKLGKTFSVAFWVSVDQPQSRVQSVIFDIQDRATIGLRVVIAAGCVLVQQISIDKVRFPAARA
jgi:hypothetical protein